MNKVYEEIKQENPEFNKSRLQGYSPTNYSVSGHSQVPGIKADYNEIFEE